LWPEAQNKIGGRALATTTSFGRVLGVDELAEKFRCSTEKIKRMARRGELPAFKFGKSWYVREEDLEHHLTCAVDSYRHLRRDSGG
jgi:excisionase family DNA binding protein